MRAQGVLDGAGAIGIQRCAEGLEAADEVEDIAAGVGAARGFAKVGAACEWAILIYEAVAGTGVEHGA